MVGSEVSRGCQIKLHGFRERKGSMRRGDRLFCCITFSEKYCDSVICEIIEVSNLRNAAEQVASVFQYFRWFTLEQAMKAQRGSGGIALLFL